jgi:hypothetical protein
LQYERAMQLSQLLNAVFASFAVSARLREASASTDTDRSIAMSMRAMLCGCVCLKRKVLEL